MPQIAFKLVGLPPSKNRLRRLDLSGRRRFESGKPQYIVQSDEYRQWSNRIWPLIPRFDVDDDVLLYLGMEFHYPYLYQNGKLRIFDAPNMQEALQDVICKRIGINDNRIKEWAGVSVDDEEEFVVVTLKTL